MNISITDTDIPQIRRQFYDDLLHRIGSGNLNKDETGFLEVLIEIAIFKKMFSVDDLSNILSRDLMPELLTLQRALSLWESFPVIDEDSVLLVLAMWNDRAGPVPRDHFPKGETPFKVDEISIQLFNAAWSFWDEQKTVYPKGMMVEIEPISRQAYILFDTIPDDLARGKLRPFMLGVIAPHINYSDSLQIKEILSKAAEEVRAWGLTHWDENGAQQMEEWWDNITRILTTHTFHYFSR